MYWTVRTYHILGRYHLEARTADEALEAARLAEQGKLRNAGLAFRAEMYRAAGLGVYEIARKLDGRKSIEEIRTLCNRLDHYGK